MKQRTCVITGASRGFGAALVRVFSKAEWAVVACSRNPVAVTDPNVTLVQWDVTEDDTSPLLEAVSGKPVDFIINNAGRGVPGTPLQDVRVDDLLEVLNVNVGGVLRTCQALLPHMRKASDPLVINVSSRLASLQDQAAGRYSHLNTSYAYRISKAAQNMATVALSAELSPTVRVIALHPGELATSMGQRDSRTPPEEAASCVLSLVDDHTLESPAFVKVSGETLPW